MTVSSPKLNTKHSSFLNFDLSHVLTPIHITDTVLLKKNLEKLETLQEKSGAKILLALKAFGQFSLFPLIRKYLKGTTASSLFEAKLAYKEFKKEVHCYAPAYPPRDFPEIAKYADHIIFNSWDELERFYKQIHKNTQIGIRVNPEHQEVENPLYNPCRLNSRLGISLSELTLKHINRIDGIHFHSLCESGADSLERTLRHLEKSTVFKKILSQISWMNWGGGHQITDENYDVELLCSLIQEFKKKYNLKDIYLEPGTAVVLNTGVLVSRVLDIISKVDKKSAKPHSNINTVILDTSASAHMPDVLEMPYLPEIIGAKKKHELPYNYTLGGLTCLSGDIIGDYSFSQKLKIGDLIYFLDMSHYTMIKNTNFNGIRTPSIAIGDSHNKKLKIIKTFDYKDYKNRLS